MPIDFPNNPSAGQTYSFNNQEWVYNGVAWDKIVIADLAYDSDALYGISGYIYASSLATGLLYGGIISINSGNSAAFDITAGKGQIHTSGSTFTAVPNPTLQFVTWPAQTGITLQYLATNDTTWIYIDGTGTVQQRTEYYTDTQLEETIIIGQLIHPSRTFINLARTNPNVAYATDKQYEQFIRSFGPIKISGHTIQPNGANLKLNRTSGSAFSLGRNWINDTDNPSVVTDAAQTDCIFYRYYRGATAGTFITVPNETAIDPTKYDNGTGTLATVPGGKYTIQRLFYYPNTPTLLGVYYGRAEYTSLADAAANINFENFTEIENTRTNAIFVGYLLIKSGCTDITNTSDALILQAGNFRSTTSGGGSVSLTLDDLTDVIITSPQNYQVLTYVDGITGWENHSVSSLPLVSSIRGLTGAVGITNGSGIGLSVSGNTLTFSNTGVLSVNGSTGSVITYAGTTGNIQFRYNNGVTANNYFTLEPANLGEITEVFTLSGATNPNWYLGNQEAIGLQIRRAYDGMGLDEGGGVQIKLLGVGNDLGDLYGSNLKISTPSSTIGGSEIVLDAGGLAGFNVNLYSVSSNLIHYFYGGMNSYNSASINTFEGPIIAAGATFSSLVRFNAGISAAGGTFGGNLRLQNGEFLQNTTNGRIDFMPAPSGSTHYGLYVDTTSWGFGPRLGTIRSSDNALNTAFILWDAPLVIGTNVDLSVGSNQVYKFRATLPGNGNSTLQIGVGNALANYSGAVAIMDTSWMGNTAARAPGVSHANPNLYVYRAGASRANDFIRFEHDGNFGRIVSGGTSGISIEPGSGILGISGGVCGGYGLNANAFGLTSGFDIIPSSWNSITAPMGAPGTVANRLYLAPISIPSRCTVKTFATQQGTSSAGNTGNIFLGLYNTNIHGLPQNLVAQSSSQSLTTTNFAVIRASNINYTANPGNYWLAICFSAGGLSGGIGRPGTPMKFITATSSSPIGQSMNWGLYVTQSGFTLSTSLSGATFTAITTNTDFPAIFYTAEGL
jgi:hypothetical protein